VNTPFRVVSGTAYSAAIGEQMVVWCVNWDKSHNGMDTTAEIAAIVDKVIEEKGVCALLFHDFRDSHGTYFSLADLRTICAHIAGHVEAGDLIVCPVGEIPDILRALDYGA